jgi:2-polyprenyl-3-methyl-5-hydroxy-6-metoxy-1,4-benzoquinol methylase
MSKRKLSSCPICGGTQFIVHSKIKDHSISQELFQLNKCQSCGFLFTNPQPEGDALWKYYQSENYISHSKISKGFINSWYKRVQNLNLQLKFNAIKKYVPRGTWLDYGAGAGDFVKFVQQKKIDILGFEPNETARKTAAQQGIHLDHPEALFAIKKETFACITLWHVLEHIPNFSEILAQFSLILKANGILVLALPDYESLDAQYYGENWAALDVPRHLWHFTQKDIDSLAKQNNLDLIKTRGMIFDSFYVSLLSEKYMNGSKLSGLLKGVQSNLSALSKSTPYSSQIYILRKKAK